MAIIKKNECYNNRYLGDFKLSLEAKGLLTIILMGQPDFDEIVLYLVPIKKILQNTLK